MKLICLIYFTAFLFCISDVSGQSFSKGIQISIHPSQVIYENYTSVLLTLETAPGPYMNSFDKNNPYTYLQLIHDINGRDYHILYQTNFMGKISLLAYSNNLVPLITGKDKPLNVFVICIRHINEQVSAIENVNDAIKCILDRLEYCNN